MIEEMKKEFEEKFCNIEYDCLTGQKIVCIKYLYSDQGDYLWNWIETKIDEACKKAKIEENKYWIDFKNKDWTNLIHTTSLQNRIKELSPKESE